MQQEEDLIRAMAHEVFEQACSPILRSVDACNHACTEAEACPHMLVV